MSNTTIFDNARGALPEMPRRPYELPPSAEWDFSRVPASETYRCCIYEYARESRWFKETIEVWRTTFFGDQPAPNVRTLLGQPELFGRTIMRALAVQPEQLGRIVELGSRGLAQGGALLLQAFPATPWQALQPEEKQFVGRFIQEDANRWFSEAYRQLLFIFQTGYPVGCQEEAALKSWLNDSLDLFVFQIDPEATRNQVELAFRNWLQDTGRFPGRGADARTTTEKSTSEFRLKHLAVSRLLTSGAVYKQRIVIDAAQERCQTPGWLPERASEWHAFPERAKTYRDRMFPPETGR